MVRRYGKRGDILRMLQEQNQAVQTGEFTFSLRGGTRDKHNEPKQTRPNGLQGEDGVPREGSEYYRKRINKREAENQRLWGDWRLKEGEKGIIILHCYVSRKMDRDNLSGKAMIDAIKRGGLIPDDSEKYIVDVRYTQTTVPKGKEKTVIEVWRLED